MTLYDVTLPFCNEKRMQSFPSLDRFFVGYKYSSRALCVLDAEDSVIRRRMW